MNEVYLLATSLVVAGLYIVYLHGVIRKYAIWTSHANRALTSAYLILTRRKEDDEDS